MSNTEYYNLKKIETTDKVITSLGDINDNMDIIDETMHEISESGGTIQDVQVDGVSVVSDGIAEIDLTDYLQTTDIATTISSSSTDDTVVTPKAVYDYIQSLDANDEEY